MRISISRLPFMRRPQAAGKTPAPGGTRPETALGRSLRDAIDWTAQSRERRKRLGLE